MTEHSVVANKPPNQLPLIDGDGAVGDPASEIFIFIPLPLIPQ